MLNYRYIIKICFLLGCKVEDFFNKRDIVHHSCGVMLFRLMRKGLVMFVLLCLDLTVLIQAIFNLCGNYNEKGLVRVHFYYTFDSDFHYFHFMWNMWAYIRDVGYVTGWPIGPS